MLWLLGPGLGAGPQPRDAPQALRGAGWGPTLVKGAEAPGLLSAGGDTHPGVHVPGCPSGHTLSAHMSSPRGRAAGQRRGKTWRVGVQTVPTMGQMWELCTRGLVGGAQRLWRAGTYLL